MNAPILSSTFFLTLLLLVGLFFFIRASVKERTERLELTAETGTELLLNRLQNYFEQRAYRIVSVNPNQQTLTFQGEVRPSGGLAVFLSVLAACGLFCLALVLSFAWPQVGQLPLGFLLLSPVAGWFYWRQAGRSEQVIVEVQGTAITIVAHRDELASLQKNIQSQTSKEINAL